MMPANIFYTNMIFWTGYPKDEIMWEYLTQYVCGRDMSGLNYYKEDLLKAMRELIEKIKKDNNIRSKSVEQIFTLSQIKEVMDQNVSCAAHGLFEDTVLEDLKNLEK